MKEKITVHYEPVVRTRNGWNMKISRVEKTIISDNEKTDNNQIPLNCPFCGARVFVSKSRSVVGDYSFKVYCGNEDCHVMPQSRYFPTREKAIFFWNVRANDDKQ